LLDFGLAKQAGPVVERDSTVTQGLTGQGQILGLIKRTTEYVFPEIFLTTTVALWSVAALRKRMGEIQISSCWAAE